MCTTTTSQHDGTTCTGIHTMNNPTPVMCVEVTHHVNEFPRFRACQHIELRHQNSEQCVVGPDPSRRCDVPPTAKSLLTSIDVILCTWPNQHLWTQQLCSFLPDLGARHVVRMTMKISLSEQLWSWRAQLPPLPNPADPRPGTQPVQQLPGVSWRVQHSPLVGHSDLLPSPLWHSVAWRYFDNSPFPTQATMNAHVFDRVEVQDRSRPIPVFYRDRWLSSALFPIRTLSAIVSSANIRSSRGPVHSKSSTCTQKENVSCFMLKNPWMSNRLLQLHVNLSSRDGPAKSLERRGFHAWHVPAYRRSDQMLPRVLQVAIQRATTSLRHHTRKLS